MNRSASSGRSFEGCAAGIPDTRLVGSGRGVGAALGGAFRGMRVLIAGCVVVIVSSVAAQAQTAELASIYELGPVRLDALSGLG